MGTPSLNPVDHSTPSVVLDELLEQVMGDREMLQILVRLFLDDLPGRVSELEQAIGSRDPERVRRAAHPIKGACAQLGAEPARQALSAIEEAGKRREIEQAEALAPAGYAELQRLAATLGTAVTAEGRA
ncbi:MAG: Hpt domain-containing protein [Polyangiaceae bacterium]|nr:Hpt domain-containing protein [Myxococcales bacterium]MCB9585157.1 Hpt domain-containing protein [Polyangiaceae bacterium]